MSQAHLRVKTPLDKRKNIAYGFAVSEILRPSSTDVRTVWLPCLLHFIKEVSMKKLLFSRYFFMSAALSLLIATGIGVLARKLRDPSDK
jgi:hypothetical protein